MAWGGQKRWGNQDKDGWKQVRPKGQWWTCRMPECQQALKRIGRKPWYNAASADVCGFCELPWQTVQSKCQHQFNEAQKEARAAASAKGKPNADADVVPDKKLSKTQARR